MSYNRELHDRLFRQQEEQQSHVEYNHEFNYYNNIAQGNIEEVKKVLSGGLDESRYEKEGYGKLSKDSLRNVRYHFVVSVALITRTCVEHGLDREMAYTMSDLYIGKMDGLNQIRDILKLHDEMLMDFTEKMASLPKKAVYSKQVVQAMDYVYKHRTQRITVEMLAGELGYNRSYLSSLFKKETGKELSDFVRSEKIKATTNMLRFSEYSYADIAEYFGFSSQSHFISCFRKEMGCTPKEYREKMYMNSLLL